VLDLQDRLFTVEQAGNSETYHLSKRNFELHGVTHTLLMVKHLTRELRRQEIEIWKKLIRVLSHELNNSLAPISSLVHSARLITKAESSPKLERVFSTVEERVRHLQDFVEGYARFARLPKPRCEHVDLHEFVQHLEAMAPYARLSLLTDGTAYFDRAQLEQVAINLLKNAREAGGREADISVEVGVSSSGGVTLAVADRGSGMSDQVLSQALLPFYSTKEQGTGLGLALCREIVEAHGGSIQLVNREGGGLTVTCQLPGFEPREAPSSVKLTLSRL
jgi:two-component system nitrogen regulation sensor histidine kinase NtrY